MRRIQQSLRSALQSKAESLAGRSGRGIGEGAHTCCRVGVLQCLGRCLIFDPQIPVLAIQQSKEIFRQANIQKCLAKDVNHSQGITQMAINRE